MLRRAAQLFAAAVIAPAAAGAAVGAVLTAAHVLGAMGNGPPSNFTDLPLALFGLILFSLSGAVLGTVVGISAGFLPALAAGTLLTWAEHRRLIRGWWPWLLAGAILGPIAAWAGGVFQGSAASGPDWAIMLVSLPAGMVGAALFRHADRFFAEGSGDGDDPADATPSPGDHRPPLDSSGASASP